MPTIDDLRRRSPAYDPPSARALPRRIESTVLEGECPHCQTPFRCEVEDPIEMDKRRFYACKNCHRDFRLSPVIPFPRSPCPHCPQTPSQ